MMTVITTVQVKESREADWDSIMGQRLASAAGHDGFVDARILHPVEVRSGRVIFGTWESQADWEAWHTDPSFVEDRSRLDALQESDGETTWYEVGSHLASPGLARSLAMAAREIKGTLRSAIDQMLTKRSAKSSI